MALGRRRKETASGAAEAATLEHLRRDLDTARADRDAAKCAREDLDGRRDEVLASEDEAVLERYENDTAAVERRLAVATTKCTRLEGELEAAEASAEQERRKDLYSKAEKALAEARRIIAEEYPAAANAVADILRRSDKLRTLADDANRELPDGFPALETILEPGGFNGFHYRDSGSLMVEEEFFVSRLTGQRAGPTDCPQMQPDRWERHTRTIERPRPLTPATPHRSVSAYVNLPGFTAETYIWPAFAWGRPRSGQVEESINPALQGLARVF